MSASPFPGAFPHQHHDPRGLVERINAQIRQRIEEAAEMAALKLLVELRQRHGQPAPETSSEADRKAFEQLATDLLTYVRNAISAELTREQRADLELVEAAQPESREALLLGQVSLARRLPDYWQRFEAHEAAHARARLEAPASRGSWLGRLLGS